MNESKYDYKYIFLVIIVVIAALLVRNYNNKKEVMQTESNKNKTMNNSTETNETIAKDNIEEDYITTADKSYISKMVSIADSYYTGLAEIDSLMSNPEPESDAWAGKLAATISLVELTCDDVENTIAPDKFLRMHKEVYFASKSYRLAMENLIDVVDNLSTSSAEKYKTNIEEANKRMEKATEELNIIKSKYEF